MLLALYGRIDFLIITYHTGQINRKDCLSILSNRICQLRIIHFKRPWSSIYHHNLSSNMTSHTSCSGICIGTSNHLITRPNPKNMKNHLHTCSSRIQAHSFVGSTICSNLPFKLLGLWACCNPARTKGLCHFKHLSLTHIGWAERNVS